ncbi:MAG TPA: TIGR04552 family protein [bacterium]|nr:TIGR04552 family protein [bacterium]
MDQKERLIETFATFTHELMDVVLSNKSFIDINGLSIESPEEAHLYLKNYGYDLDNAVHAEQVRSILNEAKSFIQTYLLEDPEGQTPTLVIPPNVLWEDDPRNFLLMASDRTRSITQRWACAVLRVAHTITHVENDLSKYFFQGIKKQIFARFMTHLNVNNKGEYFIGRGPNQIRLKLFEMKSEKTKESLIMKLLHKKENVTADVFDRVGVRIVTNDKLDVLLVLKYLAENHVISFANIKPSRTRNNLIDLEKFLEGLVRFKDEDLTNWSEEQVREYFKPYLVFDKEKAREQEELIRENNPYSSTQYTSIQLTARQLITIQDPFSINLAYKFFFPFEIQILDHESFVESRTGRASHDEYKKSQIVSVRQRVLENVLRYHARKKWQEVRPV